MKKELETLLDIDISEAVRGVEMTGEMAKMIDADESLQNKLEGYSIKYKEKESHKNGDKF
jgi:hypothetical protein